MWTARRHLRVRGASDRQIKVFAKFIYPAVSLVFTATIIIIMTTTPAPEYAGFFEIASHDALAQRVAGFVGFALFVLAAVGAAAVAVVRRRGLLTGTASSRAFMYALALALFYPMVGLNRLAWRRPGVDDHDAFNIAQLLLNTLVWFVALDELVDAQMNSAAPRRTNARNTLLGCLGVFACSAFWSPDARYLAVVMIAPMACVVAALFLSWAANDERSVYKNTTWRCCGSPRLTLLVLVPLGLVALVVELLSPTYGGVMSIGTSMCVMLGVHVMLAAFVAQLLYGTEQHGGQATHFESVDTGNGHATHETPMGIAPSSTVDSDMSLGQGFMA